MNRLIGRFRMLGMGVLALAGLLAAPTVFAGDVTFVTDTPVELSGNGIDLTILDGSDADSVVVDALDVTVTVGVGDTFSIRAPNGNRMNNDAGLTPCLPVATPTITVVGPDTVVITPSLTLCSSESSGGGGAGGSGPLMLFNYSNSPTPISTATNLPLTFVSNSLVKLADDGSTATQTDSAVYYYGRDGRRHAFPNEKVYLTWYSDFSQVQIISADDLARMPLGQNVTYRPGVRMVKFTTLSRVYAVDTGGVLRWVKSEAIAEALYGLTWNQQIDDINDAFYANYKFGNDINSIADFNPTSATAAASSIQVDMGF